MAATKVPRQVWIHPDPKSTSMFQFMQELNKNHKTHLVTFRDIYDYSISHRASFWKDCIEFLNLITYGSFHQSVDENQPIDAMPLWFSGLQLNFAENILFSSTDRGWGRRTAGIKQDDDIAITEIREGSDVRNKFTWATLRQDSAAMASSMKAAGLCKGDRVLAVASNSYHTLCVMLGATWIGGIFSSVSTDTGVQGILDRATQIKPKLVFMEDGAVLNGKTINLQQKMEEVLQRLAQVSEFKSLVSIPRFINKSFTPARPEAVAWEAFFLNSLEQPWPPFERLAFHEPMLIAFSSGTTGPPKGIVHSVGGLLLNWAKESILHHDQSPADVVLQYTTTSWIMYLSAVAPLFSGAQIVLYDASLFHPDPANFVHLLGDLKITSLGTSPGWMQRLRATGLVPWKLTDLSHLRLVTSTGMVLQYDLFEWFYDTAFPRRTQLFNMSGGTDIAGAFALGNPLSPVYIGGCQGPSLGIPLAIMDQDSGLDEDIQVANGELGELVATASFPNVPVFFWGDIEPTSPRSKLFESYFSRFRHKWTQGDLVSIDPVTQAVHFHGRADGVLNPSGVRFGSAEIYGIIERRFGREISDSLCVGKKSKNDKNESVMLFLLMEPGVKLTNALVKAVRAAIREDLSPRHVPAYIFETPEIPKTLNLKKVEVPVKRIVSGEQVKASSTLLNPSSLDYYYQFANLQEHPVKSKI